MGYYLSINMYGFKDELKEIGRDVLFGGVVGGAAGMASELSGFAFPRGYNSSNMLVPIAAAISPAETLYATPNAGRRLKRAFTRISSALAAGAWAQYLIAGLSFV